MNIVPTYRYSSVSSSSPMPIDLNEDHNHHHLFNTNHEASASSSSYSILFNPDQNQGRSSSYYWEPKHIYEEAEKLNIPSRGSSWDYQEVERNENKSSSHELKLKGCLKIKEDGNESSLQSGDDEDSSVKWMPLKMRIIRRMMEDQTGTSEHKLESSQKLPLGTDNSSSNNNSSKYNSNNNITVRVCSDCHTTKTPLWRSGPRGPKSLCNACGIRQRKARRALAAAASANGTNNNLVAAEKKPHNKLQGKGKKKRFKTECEEASPQLKKKKKHKLGVGGKSTCRGRESKFSSFEDLTMRLSKNLSHLQQVFPQDEKEAAILLMALSYGLLHGFPSHRYLDS